MVEKIKFKKFDKSKRATFEYIFWHWLAFNLVAIDLKAWKFKYLFHDIEKPWLKLLWNDYAKVQKWHRQHNSHHLEYNGTKDWEAMVIDWQSSGYTKNACPRKALEEAEYKLTEGSMCYDDYCKFVETAVLMGLNS